MRCADMSVQKELTTGWSTTPSSMTESLCTELFHCNSLCEVAVTLKARDWKDPPVVAMITH